MRSVIDVAGCTASIDPDGSACRIHAYALHHGEVDHQTVVAAAEPGTIVAAAPDCNEETLVAAEVQRGDDVGNVRAARNQARSLANHTVVKCPGRIVIGIVATDDSPTKGLLQSRDDL